MNADDEHLSRLMENPRVSKLPKRVVYFSLHENNPLVDSHTAAGNTAYFLRDGFVVEVKTMKNSYVLNASALLSAFACAGDPCQRFGTLCLARASCELAKAWVVK